MHLSACNNNSCVSTEMGSVLSLPACVFGKIKRALAVNRCKCQAFCRLGRTFVSRCSIHFQTTQWVPLRSGRLPYLCLWTIRLLALVWEDGIWSGHVLQWSFAWPLPWLLSYRSFPCHYPRYLHASSRFIFWRVSLLIVNSGASSCSLRFLSWSMTNKYVFFTLVGIPHQALNSWQLDLWSFKWTGLLHLLCRYE